MAKKLIVELVGDASSLQNSLRGAGAEAESFGTKLGHVAKIATLAIGAAGIGGLAVVLDKSVHAAMEAQTAQASLDGALRATHQSVSAMSPALEEATAAARKMGFGDAEAEQALAKLELASGSTKKATTDLGVAMDLARFKHMSVAAAAQTLSQAMTGSSRAAKQLGITVIPVTTNMDALKSKTDYASTAAYSHAKAVASLADKMATANEVIQATTDKVHGQAQAYAETAAGGMATFSAQVEFMEQKLGNALLPTLVSVMTWVNDHWPQIQSVFETVFQAIGRAIDFVKPYFNTFLAFSEQIVNRVRADWPQIQQVIEKAMNTIRDIITGVINIAEAIWDKFGSAIMTVVNRTFPAIESIIKNAFNIIAGVFQTIGDLLHGRWSQVWDDIKKIVSNALQATWTLLKTAVQDFGTIAAAIGKAILEGILHGIESLGSSLFDKLKSEVGGALSKIKGIYKIFSPSRVFADELGSPLAQGVIQGWLEGSVDLPTKMSQTIQDAITKAQKIVQTAQSSFQTAFSGFTSIADQMLGGISGAAQTAAGKKLGQIQAAHDAAALAQAISDARSGLATAQAGGDPAAILSAQQALNDALYQQTVANLQKQDAAQQISLNARNAVRQIDFDKALAQLETHLQKTHASTDTAMTAITKLLRKYGVTFGAVGADMGAAWVQGLKDSITAAAKGAGALSGTIQKQAASISVPHLDTGGYIMQSGIAMVHKGETVVPAGKGGGVNVTVPVTVNGYVGNDQNLAVKIGDAVATALRANQIPALTSAIRAT